MIEAIDLSTGEHSSYLNRKTGEIITLGQEEIRAAEEEDDLDDYLEWQRNDILLARDLLNNNKDYRVLPTKYDLDEHQLMEKFSLSLADEKTSETLYDAIKGRGVFRKFKGALDRLNLTDQWYAYRGDALRKMAIDWCELNGIHWQEK